MATLTDLSSCTILLVDDTEANIDVLVEALGQEYDITVAMDGPSALEIVQQSPPDLILLDVMMPGMDGYEVCHILKQNPETEGIPVIFLTAMTSPQDKARGFEEGAVDYMVKPFSIIEVKARVHVHLSLLMARRELALQNRMLEMEILHRTRELSETQAVIIESMAGLAETRDTDTGDHVLRARLYVEFLSMKLMDHPRFQHFFAHSPPELIGRAAILHDIGKVGVPDEILLKPGHLTAEEFETIKLHTIFSHAIFSKALSRLEKKQFLSIVDDIAYSHHEKWDGSGYPRALRGDEIPIPARLMAIADVYDAMISARVYKPAMTHEEAADYIISQSGKHFDPDVVTAFADNQNVFRKIASTYGPGSSFGQTLSASAPIDWDSILRDG